MIGCGRQRKWEGTVQAKKRRVAPALISRERRICFGMTGEAYGATRRAIGAARTAGCRHGGNNPLRSAYRCAAALARTAIRRTYDELAAGRPAAAAGRRRGRRGRGGRRRGGPAGARGRRRGGAAAARPG